MSPLNFHHLRYFWAVAKEGNLTRAAAPAARLAVGAVGPDQAARGRARPAPVPADRAAPSRLTEAGRLALDYAETHLRHRQRAGGGAARGAPRGAPGAAHRRRGHASRNFQENFIRPAARPRRRRARARLGQPAGAAVAAARALDRPRSCRTSGCTPAPPTRGVAGASPASRSASSAGRGRARSGSPTTSPTCRCCCPVGTTTSAAGFDLRCEQLGIRYRVRAEVDDMALLRLLARDSDCVALLPYVVVQDELRSGRLVEHAVVPDLYENFYGVTVQRRYEPPLLQTCCRVPEDDIFCGHRSREVDRQGRRYCVERCLPVRRGRRRSSRRRRDGRSSPTMVMCWSASPVTQHPHRRDRPDGRDRRAGSSSHRPRSHRRRLRVADQGRAAQHLSGAARCSRCAIRSRLPDRLVDVFKPLTK